MTEKLNEAKKEIALLQEELAKKTFKAEAGGGMVSVSVNGKRKLIDVSLDEKLLKEEDKEMLQDLFVAATNLALDKAEEESKQLLNEKAGEFLNLPGMNLNQWL